MDTVVLRKRGKISEQFIADTRYLVSILKDKYLINEIAVKVIALPLIQFIKSEDLITFKIKPDFTLSEASQNIGEDTDCAVRVDLNI